MNKFDDMMGLLCTEVVGFGQVVAIDRNFDIFGRAWCQAEIVEAKATKMPQSLKVHSSGTIDQNRTMLQNLDVRHCHAARQEDKDEILAKIQNLDEFNVFLINAFKGFKTFAQKRPKLLSKVGKLQPVFFTHFRGDVGLNGTFKFVACSTHH